MFLLRIYCYQTHIDETAFFLTLFGTQIKFTKGILFLAILFLNKTTGRCVPITYWIHNFELRIGLKEVRK